MPGPERRERRSATVLLAAIALAAVALRLWQLGQVPPGFQFDEAHNALDAARVLDGQLAVFFPDNGGREPLLAYLQALALAVLGPANTVPAIRLVSALAGLLTVALLYRFVLGFLGDRLVASLAAGFLALSYWHVHFSRYGIRAVLAPLWAVGAVWMWWRAVGPPAEAAAGPGAAASRRWAALCGLCLAGAFYSHPTGRLLPLVLLGHAAYRTLADRPGARPVWRSLGLAAAVAFLLGLPLLAYFLSEPARFLAHPSDVSLASVAAEQFGGNLALALAHHAGALLGMFFLAGDPSTFHNLPGLPVFDALSALLFVIGLGVLLGWLASRAGGRRDRAVLLLLWLVLLLLPTLVSDRPPNYSRAIAALPVIALLPALGLGWLLERLPAGRAAWRPALAGLALIVAGLWTARHYFVDFAGLPQAYYSYDVEKLDAYRALAALAEEANVFLHPLWAEHATIAYLNRDGPVRTLDGTDTLVLGADGRDSLVAFPAEEAEEQGWLERARSLYGPLASEALIRDARGRPLLATFRVPAAAAGNLAPPTDAPLEPVQWMAGSRFGGMIELVGYRVGTARRGQPLPLTFTWRVVEPPYTRFTTFVHLLGPGGEPAGQEDREPGHASLPTAAWQPGDVVIDRFAPLVTEDAAGPLAIRVGWYDSVTGDRLGVAETDQLALKPVDLVP
jgi:4-amino-4-deoxy-L-arabinose transferase-like glycosyltransferase